MKTAAGWTYTYDADGNRVRKDNGSGGYTEYIYWGSEPIAERDQSGAWTDYIFANGQRIAQAPGTLSTAGTIFYHADHLGSARIITDLSGAQTWSATYLPFGYEFNATGSAPTHYKFTGKERDAESGLDYFGARYYTNNMGRWISTDPVIVSELRLTNPQGWNQYSYVLNNPILLVDPNGREAGLCYGCGPKGQTLSPLDKNYPPAPPLSHDPVLWAGAGVALATGVGEVAGAASAAIRSLGAAAMSYFMSPSGQQAAQDMLEGLTPGQRLTLGRASELGVSSVTKLGENGFVGTLEGGAQISAGFEKAGGNFGVNISNVQSAAKGSLNFKSLESSAVSLARKEGATTATLKAVNVVDTKLAGTLVKAGYVAQQVTDKFGRTTINYVKTVTVKK